MRELLQNASDAVLLRQATSSSEGWNAVIHVAKEKRSDGTWLLVTDNGVGMSKAVLTRHLIGVASDFWHSVEFFRDFGDCINRTFKSIGRFGIGFLSVFMIGDVVEVETESMHGQRYVLRLRGVGRRGELNEIPDGASAGRRSASN